MAASGTEFNQQNRAPRKRGRKATIYS